VRRVSYENRATGRWSMVRVVVLSYATPTTEPVRRINLLRYPPPTSGALHRAEGFMHRTRRYACTGCARPVTLRVRPPATICVECITAC